MIDFTEIENALLAALPAIILACVITIAILIVWLGLRPLRTWYWKVDDRKELLAVLSRELEDLNEQIKDLKKELRLLQEVKDALRENRQMPENVQIREVPSPAEAKPEKKVSAEKAPAEDSFTETFNRTEPERSGYDTDKFGRKYTMEEIDLQIKD